MGKLWRSKTGLTGSMRSKDEANAIRLIFPLQYRAEIDSI